MALADPGDGGPGPALEHAKQAIRGLTGMFPSPDDEYLEALLALRRCLSAALREEREPQRAKSSSEMGLDTLWLEIRKTRGGRESRWRLGAQQSGWMSATETATARMYVRYLSRALQDGNQVLLTTSAFADEVRGKEQVACSDVHLRKARSAVGRQLLEVLDEDPRGSRTGKGGGLVFNPDPLHAQGVRTVTFRVSS